MNNPIPYVVEASGDAEDAPNGAIPLALFGAGGSEGGAVDSVNGQTGTVVLDAADVSALPDSYTPPAPTWAEVTGKPAVIAAGVTASAARIAIGVNTPVPAIPGGSPGSSFNLQVQYDGEGNPTVQWAPVA